MKNTQARNTQMDLNLMRTFRIVYDEKSLTVAAEQLGLTQPAVSYSLARLRDLLGDPLFLRTGQGMQPTPAAHRLAEQISEGLDLIDNALQTHQKFDPNKDRRVYRLTMSDIGEMVFLPPLCEYLARHAPGVRLEVGPVSLEALPDALRTGSIDLAIGNFPVSSHSVHHASLFHEEYACMIRARHPLAKRKVLSPDDFLSLSHIFVASSMNAHRMLEDILLAQGVHRQIALQVPHFTVVPDILLRTDMICTIPHVVARQFNLRKEFRIFKLPIPVPPTDVAVHWHARFDSNQSNRWLREVALKLLR